MTERGEVSIKVLICFDCDGTIFTTESLEPDSRVSQRPVPLERVRALQEMGAQIVIVSPSDACEELSFPKVLHPDRGEALREAARRYPADLRLYVSDNYGDDKTARRAGFSYVHPDNFR